MKLSLVCLLFLATAFLLTPQSAFAQSTSTNAALQTSEQSLQELVREVRQLRATLQRINAAMYRGQVILERLKLQQEQVTRVSRELAEIRENLGEIRAQQNKLKELVSRTETGVEGGQHLSTLHQLKGELELLKEREQRLTASETRLAHDLEVERAKLNELNDRLNALEQEMVPNKP